MMGMAITTAAGASRASAGALRLLPGEQELFRAKEIDICGEACTLFHGMVGARLEDYVCPVPANVKCIATAADICMYIYVYIYIYISGRVPHCTLHGNSRATSCLKRGKLLVLPG